jgi:hypothetical protein
MRFSSPTRKSKGLLIFLPRIKDVVEELEPKDMNTMMKYRYVLLPLMKPSTSLFLLHKKKRMRLVTFLFRILIIPYSMIQRVKEKWNPWER